MKKFATGIFILILGICFGVIFAFFIFAQDNLKISKQMEFDITAELTHDEVNTTFKDWENKDFFGNKEIDKLSKFLRENNLMILPGKYKISQATTFEDTLFIFQFGDNSKHD